MAESCPICGRPTDSATREGCIISGGDTCYRLGYERLAKVVATGTVGQVVGGRYRDGMVYLTLEFNGSLRLPGVGAMARITREVPRG